MNSLLLELKKRRVPFQNNSIIAFVHWLGEQPPLYGLPKVHKPDAPLQPIIAYIYPPSYQLSQYLARVLPPVVSNMDSRVMDLVVFNSLVQAQRLMDEEILVSFNVMSLFTV